MSEHEDMVESSWSAIEWFARSNKAGDDIAVEVTADETDDECAMLLSDYVKALGARQLSETVERNVAALLEQNPALAFSVVKSYANTRMFDTSEMYVASLGVVAAACGLAPIADPLGEYRESFRRKGSKPPRNPDGSLRYTVDDVDVDVLNANHAVLRLCWNNLLTRSDAFDAIPPAIVGVGPTDAPSSTGRGARPASRRSGWGRCPRTPSTRPACAGSANTGSGSTCPPRARSPRTGTGTRGSFAAWRTTKPKRRAKMKGKRGRFLRKGRRRRRRTHQGEPGRRAVRRVPPAVPVERQLGGRGG